MTADAGLTVDEREHLAQLLTSNTVPWLTYGVHTGDERMVADALMGLDWQELAALAVVLAKRCARPLMRPDDGVIDEVAIARACRGEPVPLTGPERIAAARALAAQGIGATQAAERLHVSGTTGTRLYARLAAEQAAADEETTDLEGIAS